MRRAVLWLALAGAGCNSTIRAQDYSSDCDADLQCVRISVGDVCSCDCNLAAINDRDYDKYLYDLQRIGAGSCHTTCTEPDGAPSTCGLGIGARCSASGQCETYQLPDAGAD
jgi:hypothetical protein